MPCGDGEVILVDGAKRDRMIWPGDMGVSVSSLFATLGDTTAAKNAINTLFDYQNRDTGQHYGMWVCPLLVSTQSMTYSSDTYHLWAIVGACDLFNYLEFLASNSGNLEMDGGKHTG